MFSYRHVYHAGNHADVLKHIVLIASLKHLLIKDTALTVVDTHAGTGLYQLHSAEAQTSGEAAVGVLKLQANAAALDNPPDALQDYLDVLARFNGVYPGSPAIIKHLLRSQDKLKLFELLGADARLLSQHMEQFGDVDNIQILTENGFLGLKKFIPPSSRRALVLMDPSYEAKTDYMNTYHAIADAVKRFATGCYIVWYPIIARPEAHDLPRKLKTLANQNQKSWLNATLSIKGVRKTDEGNHSKLSASGVFVINTPHSLKPALNQSLAVVAQLLGEQRPAQFTLSASGG